MMIYNGNPHHVSRDLLSVQTSITVLKHLGATFLIGKRKQRADGLSRQTFIRNTSIHINDAGNDLRTIDDPKVAYAFVDEGCYGKKGLDSVRLSMKKEGHSLSRLCWGRYTVTVFGNYFSNEEQWLKVDKVERKKYQLYF